MNKSDNFKPDWVTTSMTIGMILFITWLFTCCNFVDFQLDALTCNPSDLFTAECIDEEFYGCPLSLRRKYVGNCNDIDEVVIEKYNINFGLYLDCCTK